MKFLNFLKYNRESFGAKIFYLFTVFFVTLYFAFTAFFIYYQSKTLKQNLIQEGKELANLLAYSSRLGVFAENKDLLKDPIEGIMQNEEVMLIQVFTVDGKELITKERLEKETPESPQPPFIKGGSTGGLPEDKTIDVLKSKSPFYFKGDNKIEFWSPVISSSANNLGEEDMFFSDDSFRKQDNIIGFIRIVLTTEQLDKTLRDILLKSILIMAFFMILGWIVIYFIVRGITKPLNRLTESAISIGAGDSVETITIETKDEIGKLALAFNNMVESLKSKEVEKQKIEEQLRHAQKMEAIGTLAGGIAHDFNNTLSTIIGYGLLLQKNIKEGDTARKYLDHLLSSARRAAVFTQGLLTFSRKEVSNPRPVNINNVIKNEEDILMRLLGEDIKLRVELAEEELIVMAEVAQIDQVLMNIATNARDAMPDGGSLTITTKRVEQDKKNSISIGHEEPGKYAMISVIDTGTGMDDQVKDRIFDPFFTTKEVGKGTGIGLSMVYGIIKQHKGFIDVSSDPGKGTTFKIYLPLSRLAIKEKESDTLKVPKGGTETILIAEDDENVRSLAKTILEQNGYKVIEAIDGKDALGKYVENKDKIEFLLFDVIMPKKNGKEVYERIKKINPDIKVLFISGYTADVIHENGRDVDNTRPQEEGINFLPKPVLPDELLKKVREILDK